MDETLAALEAVLAAAARPLSDEELARVLELSRGELSQALTELQARLASPDRGLRLERVAGGSWLTTKSQFAKRLSQVGRPVKEGGLSPATLETLALVAYRQPITRPAIEAVRGVRSEAAITALSERGLIEEVGRDEGPGRPILYGTTEAFLIHFGLEGPEDLPPLATEDDAQLTRQLELDFDAASDEVEQR